MVPLAASHKRARKNHGDAGIPGVAAFSSKLIINSAFAPDPITRLLCGLSVETGGSVAELQFGVTSHRALKPGDR